MKTSVNIRRLNDKEVRYLRNQRSVQVRRRRSLWRRSLSGYIVIFGGLALLTYWAEIKNPKIIFSLWGILGAAISIPSFIDEWRRLSRCISDFDHALAQGICEELVINSVRMWEFEEDDDEGACYAFELATGGVIIVCGQDFYPGARFPNTDFSIIEIRDRKQNVLEMIVEKRGKKMIPERRVSAQEKKSIAIPEHGTLFPGSLEAVYGTLKNA